MEMSSAGANTTNKKFIKHASVTPHAFVHGELMQASGEPWESKRVFLPSDRVHELDWIGVVLLLSMLICLCVGSES